MNRSTFILGFALLAVAVTLAATITLRNAPGTATRPAQISQRTNTLPTGADQASAARTDSTRPAGRELAESLEVSLPASWLEAFPAEEQALWQARVTQVETQARQQLERLTAELDLSPAQRRKLFPTLIRSTPGYDPAMLVGGVSAGSDTALTAGEEIHEALDPEQQAAVEDQEVKRQLWWQDVLSKLEADLVESTGGAPATETPTPPTTPPPPPTEERVAPGPRQDGNLFDLLPTQP